MKWLSYLTYIPDLIELVKSIQKQIDEAQTKRKVGDDIKSIKKAFDEKDASALNHIFNNSLPDDKANQ